MMILKVYITNKVSIHVTQFDVEKHVPEILGMFWKL